MTGRLWVWEDTPPATWPHGYDSVTVKAFDGRSTSGGPGAGWVGNFRAWQERFGSTRVHAWGVAYQDDGEALGGDIAAAVHGAPSLTLDIEDWNGRGWTNAELSAVVHGMRAQLNAVPLGYSSYATRAQCVSHGIDQAALDGMCDFAMPQVYFPYQGDEIGRVLADHRKPMVTVSPGDDPAWLHVAGTAAVHTGGVAFWRMGAGGWEEWGMQLDASTGLGPAPVPPADPMRPATWAAFPPAAFIAWDGVRWWVTDVIHRRPATQADAEGLHKLGLAVRWWPSCAVETVLAGQ